LMPLIRSARIYYALRNSAIRYHYVVASKITTNPFTTLNAGLPFATLREDFNPHDQTLTIGRPDISIDNTIIYTNSHIQIN
jgi:hypothetical protein